ncbi:hypothetical protein PCCS19_57780 [Paenibacillus sp. CCS19]|nr:hypothetical protein PCCS19_57780 [Paenibacillus cellulosilyticus]
MLSAHPPEGSHALGAKEDIAFDQKRCQREWYRGSGLEASLSSLIAKVRTGAGDDGLAFFVLSNL